MRYTTRTAGGFTLIELLIVVAIIAILAAIAVPNFLQAQVRAKAARVKNDMRAIATALEGYCVDNNSYPRDHDNNDGVWDRWDWERSEVGFYYLTTPIAYITSLSRDPFSISKRESDSAPGFGYVAPFYVLASGSDNQVEGVRKERAYAIISLGPDKDDDTGLCDHWPWAAPSGRLVEMLFYDPTNGAMSMGDMYRFGGNYRTGNWIIGDKRLPATWVPWQQWGPPMVTP